MAVDKTFSTKNKSIVLGFDLFAFLSRCLQNIV